MKLVGLLLVVLVWSGCRPEGPHNYWTCRQESGWLAAPAGHCDIRLDALEKEQSVDLPKDEVRSMALVRVKAQVASFDGRIRFSLLDPERKEKSIVVEPGQTAVLESAIRLQGMNRDYAPLNFERLDPGPRVVRGRAIVLYRTGKGDFPAFPKPEP